MHSSQNTRRFSALAIGLILGAVSTRLPAQCTSTDTVVVRLECPNVKAEEFSILLHTRDGEQPVTVHRNGKAWSEVVPTFDITGSRLVSADVPNLRTACNVRPAPDAKIGVKCVALYRVTCDSTWNMKVASAEAGEEFRFKVDPRLSCSQPGTYLPAATPRDIAEIGTQDKVFVAVQRSESFVSVIVTQSVLRQYRGTARFSDLPPVPAAETPITGGSLRYLRAAQADRNRDLTFSISGGGGE